MLNYVKGIDKGGSYVVTLQKKKIEKMKFLKNMHNSVDTIKRDSPILPDGRFDTTTEPLRGSMIAYSGQYEAV